MIDLVLDYEVEKMRGLIARVIVEHTRSAIKLNINMTNSVKILYSDPINDLVVAETSLFYEDIIHLDMQIPNATRRKCVCVKYGNNTLIYDHIYFFEDDSIEKWYLVCLDWSNISNFDIYSHCVPECEITDSHKTIRYYLVKQCVKSARTFCSIKCEQ